MNDVTFIVLAIFYVSCLSVLDGVFNRLVFRQNRFLSYSSSEKAEIYNMWEWKVVGVILLILMPIIFPTIISFIIGGLYFVKLYFISLLIVPWDIIFGKLVFNNWFGDTPSIALPITGWIHLPLWFTYLLRVLAILIIIFLL